MNNSVSSSGWMDINEHTSHNVGHCLFCGLKLGIEFQNAILRIAVLPIMDVRTHLDSTLQLLQCAFRWSEITCEWLKNPKCSDHRPLFTTHDPLTIVDYVMEVLGPFRYWTLWMSKTHTVTLHHVITAYNDMFNHMDRVMRAFAKERTPWKEDLFFAVKVARQKLSKYYAEVTPSQGMLPISAHILYPFQKVGSFRKWDKRMNIDPEDETSHSTQYQEAFLKYIEKEYCAKTTTCTGQ